VRNLERKKYNSGVLDPVLDDFAVGFRVMHGFGSATAVHDISQQDDDGRPLIILYVGDRDPSGMHMSEADLPNRLSEYGGHHITLKRIALTQEQVCGLPSFSASDKRKDRGINGSSATTANLRACVEKAIKKLIDPVEWERCETVNEAEQESLRTVLDGWIAARRRHSK
jgi:hypothetical protein